jgi:D-glycero-alpha-D-manno-heptose-7-phosphate kinase
MSRQQDKIAQFKEMLQLVDEAQAILENKHSDFNDFGRLLDHTWRLKRATGGKVSNSFIDEIYDKGIKAGALGGKLLGAGGGGFLLFYVEPDKRQNVLNALDNLMNVPFAFENEGTNIAYYNPETYIPRKEITID